MRVLTEVFTRMCLSRRTSSRSRVLLNVTRSNRGSPMCVDDGFPKRRVRLFGRAFSPRRQLILAHRFYSSGFLPFNNSLVGFGTFEHDRHHLWV
ncbi:unnamed protein product, partial [Dicrocoelium dendriticum]